jgi:23S rRNA-intervening sequence protein
MLPVKSSKFQHPSSRETTNFKHRCCQRDEKNMKYPETSDVAFLLNDAPAANTPERHAFDLEERTAKFGEDVIRFVKKVPRTPKNDRLISQLVGCGTSVGANYSEANEAVSKKDFKCTIGRCVKEAKETKVLSSNDRRFRTKIGR